MRQLTTPLIIASYDRINTTQRPIISFDVPKLSHQEQLAVWKSHLDESFPKLDRHLESLTATFNLSSSIIQTACSQLNNSKKITPNANTKSMVNQLWNFCRSQSRPQLEDLAQRIDCKATWQSLILPKKERKILKEITGMVRQRFKVYQEWGFAHQGERGLGIAAMFAGESGTGKTLAAEVLANELNLDLYRIDLSTVVSKYIGETEKNLSRIFDAAEAGGGILLFDEADALFGKRTDVKDSHDRHANIEVSYLLQRMEAYKGLAILTTNIKSALDVAFLRRLRFIVSFPFPLEEHRMQIWKRMFPPETPTKGLNLKYLAELNITGGTIRNIALNAAFLAAEANEPLMMKHILDAAESEYEKLQRPLNRNEYGHWLGKKKSWDDFY